MKWIAWVIIVLLVIVGVVMYGNQRAQQATIQVSYDSLAMANEKVLEQIAADSLLLDSLAQANARRDSVEAELHVDLDRARATVQRRTSELDEFLAHAPPEVIHDTVIVILTGALKAARDEAWVCGKALNVCDSTKAAQGQQIVILTEEKVDLLKLNEAANGQLETAMKALHPGIFKQVFSVNTGGMLKVVGALVIGVLVGGN